MHQLALPDGGASLHAGNIGRALGQRQTGHTGGNRARRHDEIFVLGEVELIDHSTQQVGVNLPAWGNEAGTDFYDNSHMLICVPPFTFYSLPRNSILASAAPPAGRDNISILTVEWDSGKLKNLCTLEFYACFECHP